MLDIAYVYGDDDYAASTWEELREEVKQEQIYRLTKGEEFIEFATGCYVELRRFNDVDKEFINFIKAKIQDYDDAKHTNFYVV